LLWDFQIPCSHQKALQGGKKVLSVKSKHGIGEQILIKKKKHNEQEA